MLLEDEELEEEISALIKRKCLPITRFLPLSKSNPLRLNL